MNLLNKLTIKNLKLNRKRTIMTVIGIMLSAALLSAVANMFFCAKESLILYQKQQQGDYHYGFETVSKEELSKLEQNRNIDQIYVTSILGYAKLEGVGNEYKPYAYVKEYTQDALLNMCVNLKDGRYPEKAAEIVIPSNLKTNGGLDYKVGDRITLEVGTRVSDGEPLGQLNPYNPEVPEEIIGVQTKEYTVVGIMERLPYRLDPYEAPGYTFVSYLEDESVIEAADVYVKYTKEALKNLYQVTADILEVDADAFEAISGGSAWKLDAEQYEKLQAKIENPKFNYICNDYLLGLETGVFGDSTINALMAAAVMVVLIIIATSVFCIKNSFDISIAEKIRQYGMLASIGATSKQIKKNVYYEATLLGLMGIPLGLLSGTCASYVLIKISDVLLDDILMFDLIFEFSWLAMLLAAILGFVTIILSAKKSAKNASKISPIQAIRNSEEVKVKREELGVPKWVKRFFGIGGEVSYKNWQRSKQKYQATIISIVVGVSVFIGLSSFVNTAFQLIHANFGDIQYNLQLSYNGEQDMFELTEDVRLLEGVTQVTTVGYEGLNIGTTTESYTEEYHSYFPGEGEEWIDENGEKRAWMDGITVCVLDETSFKEYAASMKLNYQEVREKGIFVNTIYTQINEKQIQLEKFSFQEGDVIKGEVGHWDNELQNTIYEPFEIEVAKLTQELPIGVSPYTSAARLVVCGEEYQDVFWMQSRSVIYIDTENADKTQEDLEGIIQMMTDESERYSIQNLEENEKGVRSFYTLVSIFLYGFITVIALIGVTNIFNTISTNMNLRRREFAMLRSIGMTKKEFNRMILLESFFYGMKSLMIGIPIGLGLSWILYDIVMNGEWTLSYCVPVKPILFSVAAVFLLIAVVMKYSLGKISQQNTIETIRNENI